MTENRSLPVSILRGGTSRGLFFRASDLPAERGAIEPILLNVFGSPDIRQIDGLGGATSQTSKAAIIGPPSRPDADVDYTFAQVAVGSPLVDWGGNCGNLSSAVGPYAVDAGFVSPVEGVTVVRIHNTNTSKLIVSSVPVRDGRAMVEGDYAIPGVPGTGARIDLDFREPGGSLTGRLLPTGRPVDEISLTDGRKLRVSIVDAANPVVFVRASDLGAAGSETPVDIEADPALTDRLEEVRAIVAEWLGLVPDRAVARERSPGLPKVGMVSPPIDYVGSGGQRVRAAEMDLSGRLMSMQTAHRSYPVTGAIATAAAAMIEGTVVHDVTRAASDRSDRDRIRIGNPYGVMDALVSWSTRADGAIDIEGVRVGRTARHILDGTVFVPAPLLPEAGEPSREFVSARSQ